MKQLLLFFAWLIALCAMLTTLLMSQFFHWPVCQLCWYQRIFIYPLVILLGMAAYRDEALIIPYALPFPVIAFVFAVYQYLEQMIPGFAPIELCSQQTPCSATHIKLLGFITIPFLSAIACGMIVVLLLIARRCEHRA